MVIIVIYLFVHDDSLTSKRFATRTEQLTKCYEPLQKMRVMLGPSKTGLSPPPPKDFYITLQGDTSVIVLFILCFGVEYLCCLNLMYVVIVLLKFG